MKTKLKIQKRKHQTEDNPVQAKAKAACVKKINALFLAIQRDITKVGQLGVAIANNAMQLGFYFQELSGSQQLEMHFFTAIPGLNNRLSYEIATRCVSLARRREGAQFKHYAEAEPELKLLLQGTLTSPPERQRALGEPLLKNWGQWIPSAFTPLNTELQALTKDEPVEEWSVERLETFTAQTKFVHDLHERAQALLSAKDS